MLKLSVEVHSASYMVVENAGLQTELELAEFQLLNDAFAFMKRVIEMESLCDDIKKIVRDPQEIDCPTIKGIQNLLKELSQDDNPYRESCARSEKPPKHDPFGV